MSTKASCDISASTLRYEPYIIDSVLIGQESSVPNLQLTPNVQHRTRACLDEDDELFLGYGTLPNVFPYSQQDLYTRELKTTAYDSYILENDFLRAQFLPQLGGRLISLIDKTTGKDLLYQNDVLYVGNLALRNAWFSGGVEWNMGMVGHNPFTCSPLFVAETALEDGTPVLRMYEYERIRGITFQLDFFLPAKSRILFVRVRLANESGQITPSYWWSNIAVPMWERGRVVIPAEQTYAYKTDCGVCKESVPVTSDGIDITYPNNTAKANDFFWKIPKDSRKYIAHINEDGWGLVQSSTSRLRGRKLFVWGHTKGSDHFQQFLSGSRTKKYTEIQAGLAQTQYECVPMPPHTAWEWLETYGPIQVDAEKIHGNWETARQTVSDYLDQIITPSALESLLTETRDTMAKQPAKLLQTASGWGALEQQRRKQNNLPPMSAHLDFGEIDDHAQPWAQLLAEETLGIYDPAQPPLSWLPDKEYIPLLQKAVTGKDTENYYTWLQLGVGLYAHNLPGAEDALLKSLQLTKNLWAAYALSCLYLRDGKTEDSVTYAQEALAANTSDLSVAKNCIGLLLKNEAYREVLQTQAQLAPELRADPRIQLYYATAYFELDQIAETEAILTKDNGLIVPDIREGERSTSTLYIKLQQKKTGLSQEEVLQQITIPENLDFRMS